MKLNRFVPICFFLFLATKAEAQSWRSLVRAVAKSAAEASQTSTERLARRKLLEQFAKEDPKGFRSFFIKDLGEDYLISDAGKYRIVYEHPFDSSRVVKIWDDFYFNHADKNYFPALSSREHFLYRALRKRGVPLAQIDQSPHFIKAGAVVQERMSGITFFEFAGRLSPTSDFVSSMSASKIAQHQQIIRNARAQVEKHSSEISRIVHRLSRRGALANSPHLSMGDLVRLDLHEGNFIINPETKAWKLVDF